MHKINNKLSLGGKLEKMEPKKGNEHKLTAKENRNTIKSRDL
jgi:hypothetical protein